MYATLIAVAALWGAATGLLVPRAAYRLSVQPDEPWRDACPAGHPFTGPARGWLGAPRCAPCAVAVPVGGAGRAATSAPATGAVGVPVVTALVCGALAAATGPRPELVVWLLAAPVAVLLALVDRAVHRLPDRLTLPLATGTAALLGVAALLPWHAGAWSTALLGGLALGAGYAVLFLVNPSGMGFGDVKLALALGVVLGWYGWGVLFTGAFAGFLFGAVYGFGLVALRRASRKSAIPFGPFMMGGALVGVLLGGFAAVPAA
ncbi:prepilin peptidase [Streptomyces sp. WAC05374]|uniref:prepilin peptidase n=1 Tax=Streptomyces sp. WAC05374 TaxID=2487420 RepID=UPI000F886590|nr:A24 family peptidase [Streptomyces sp. WAC05374]RST05728.1 prepilin peptidase [Streptomyces sp. WAC05374]TDF43240.1 prepilin peptidase [Streptomyces sp. WAC05374]TDF51026.1 prepilin peptidase [Streptomyces sp. WAC05374]TDF52231.1 prepilin peptidase [Streptomyces sp. WAC05374]